MSQTVLQIRSDLRRHLILKACRGMVGIMDKASALKILGLGPEATSDEAKKRFRALAKSHHPDRHAKDDQGADAAEARMKEINAAFHFLAPLLPSGSVQETEKTFKEGAEKDTDQSKPKRTGFFSWMRKRWQQKTRSARARSPLKKESARSVRPNRPAANPRGFDSLLASMAPNRRPSPKNRRGQIRGKNISNRPYDNYRRYMDVKKRLQRSRQGVSQAGIGRVEKIRPVQRVTPVGDR